MQIINSGIMFVAIHMRTGVEMEDADEWARALGSRVRAKESEIRGREQAVAMKREIIAEKMPGKWDELMRLFQSHCEAHNRNNNPPRLLSCHPLGHDTFEVKPEALPAIVTVAFNRSTYEIMVRTPSGAKWYLPSAVMRNNGDVDLVERGNSHELISLPQIVMESLADAILRGRIDY